ncbi:MAG: SGNH/GDSL hydrolase family protein, partial [Defluviitaleaceae bacterium]|nr:SGNH/GDSL hydrolase family protein [Defluviitaleaceae bacterium]
SKLRAVKVSRMPGESFLSYLFPLLRYHDRWRELTADDFKYFFGTNKRVSFNGYMMRSDVKPLGMLPRAPRLPDYSFSDKSWRYLDKIRQLCEANGIRLALVKSPSLFPHWYDEWDEQIRAYAGEHGLLYINSLAVIDEIGIDYSTDTYNAGLHLNIYGAEKFAAYLGKVLQETFGLPDNRGDPELSEIWARKVSSYNETHRAQLEELEKYGEIRTFLYEPAR